MNAVNEEMLLKIIGYNWALYKLIILYHILNDDINSWFILCSFVILIIKKKYLFFLIIVSVIISFATNKILFYNSSQIFTM